MIFKAIRFELNQSNLFPKMAIKSIESIVKEWETKGNEPHPKNPQLPLHPEFFYRISNQWKGWNDFLDLPTSSPKYEHNLVRDEVESKAWILYQNQN